MNATATKQLTKFEQAFASMPNHCVLCGASSDQRFCFVSKHAVLDGLLILHTLCETCANKPESADVIEARILKGTL
jgi:hypothetical protein